MANLEETLAQGVKEGKIPHAVVFATNKDGMSFLLTIETKLYALINQQVASHTSTPSGTTF